jgi:hypothetical protein
MFDFILSGSHPIFFDVVYTKEHQSDALLRVRPLGQSGNASGTLAGGTINCFHR